MAVVHRAILVIGLFLCVTGAVRVRGADSLKWSADKSKVTADVQTWDLLTLLENVATATGWEIYVEPKTRYQASAKFKERPPGEALKMLLGNLSYALLPQTNGASKLYVFRNNRNDATQLVRGRKKSDKLDKELIVTMKAGGVLDTNALGAKVTGKIDKLNAYRLQFKDAAAAEEARKKLEGDENVDLVDSNYEIARPPNAESLAVSAIPGLDLKIKPNPIGDGPIIGLIDTVVQRGGGARDGFLLPQISVAGEAAPADDEPTHGTIMTENFLHALEMQNCDASNARILPVDIYGNMPSASTFNLIDGLVKALEGHVNIVNMSLGSTGGNELTHRIIQEASAKGVLFFGAAGNEHTTAPTYPAAYPEVTAVTAVDRNGKIAPYANYGEFVDVGAPGTAIVPFDGRSYVVMGTSPSTAWASGLAAGLMACGTQPSAIPAQMRSIMAVPPQDTGGR